MASAFRNTKEELVQAVLVFFIQANVLEQILVIGGQLKPSGQHIKGVQVVHGAVWVLHIVVNGGGKRIELLGVADKA